MISNTYPHLLSPGRINKMEVKNRIMVTAMGVSLSEEDGTVGEKLIAYHEEQARGGAGLIICGVAGVAWRKQSGVDVGPCDGSGGSLEGGKFFA
jgi:2,4-dienoyl-CoA reductase-like NADH-dependent reductase (Old Yellow Enzyme family)